MKAKEFIGYAIITLRKDQKYNTVGLERGKTKVLPHKEHLKTQKQPRNFL